MQNTNSTPFLTTAPGENFDPAAYPKSMVGADDNRRARASRMSLCGWRAPSDGHADAWLDELEREVPD